MGREQGDDRSRQIALAHVDKACLIDEMRGVAGIKEFQEIEPALGIRGYEGGELIIADVRAHAIARLVPRTGIVNGDPIRYDGPRRCEGPSGPRRLPPPHWQLPGDL
jgi:hypothetical protein